MKQLIMFVGMMLISLTAFSQTDTTYLSIPTSVARQIAIDLSKCDSIQAELNSTKKILKTVEQQSVAKDIVIIGLEDKIKIQAKQLSAYEELDKKHKKLEGKLHKDLDSAQSKAKFYRDGFAVASTVATLLGSIMWLITR